MANKRTKEKWAVYALTIVTFACAVWVITWPRGTNRTVALAVCYGVLVVVAILQSVRRSRARKDKSR